MDATARWDAAFAGGDEERSWTQRYPGCSLELVKALVAGADEPIIDVGGGASRLACELLAAGFGEVTVLDLSRNALELARSRLGDRAERVTWITADLLAWKPPRRYGLWHDRAVLHFFTEEADRERYAVLVAEAVRPGGHAVIATFAPNGPTECSGLPIRRTSSPEVAALLGSRFVVVKTHEEDHVTPTGHVQPFVWTILRRVSQ